jgi:hypothetical protein
LHALKAHVEQALLPEGFHLRIRLDVVGSCDAQRLTGEVCGRRSRSGEFSENSPYLQGGFEEEKSKKKILTT